MEHPDSNDTQIDWHYTAGDDQAGPVTFEELKALAASGQLHPRHDMAWCHGMDEWIPAGEIEGLFERKATDPNAEGHHSDADQPKSILELEGIKNPFAETELFPGASRRWWLFLVCFFPIIWIMLALAFAGFAGPSLAPSLQLLLMLIGVIIPVWVVIDTTLSRLTNVGMTKWWFFGCFVPLVNLWVGYRIFACPAGYARTKKLDGPGWLLALVYWIMILGSTASALLAPAAVENLMNHPEIRKYVDDLKQSAETAKEVKKKASKTTADEHKERERKREEEKRKKAAQPAP